MKTTRRIDMNREVRGRKMLEEEVVEEQEEIPELLYRRKKDVSGESVSGKKEATRAQSEEGRRRRTRWAWSRRDRRSSRSHTRNEHRSSR